MASPSRCRLSTAAAAAGGAEPVPTPGAGPGSGAGGWAAGSPAAGVRRAAGSRYKHPAVVLKPGFRGKGENQEQRPAPPGRPLGEAGGREPGGAGPAARGAKRRWVLPARGWARAGVRRPAGPACPAGGEPVPSTRNGAFPAEAAVFLVPFPAVSHASESVVGVHRPRQSLKTEATGCFLKMAGKNKYR